MTPNHASIGGEATPGPWEADFGTEGYFFLTHSDGLELPQTRENLNVLGAAPDLLLAAELALQALVGTDRILHANGLMKGLDCPVIEPLRGAIAKARGHE